MGGIKALELPSWPSHRVTWTSSAISQSLGLLHLKRVSSAPLGDGSEEVPGT